MTTYVTPRHEEYPIPTGLPAESKLLRRQRLRISNACQACRQSKAKCDGARPACGRCQGRGRSCLYSLRQSDRPAGFRAQAVRKASTSLTTRSPVKSRDPLPLPPPLPVSPPVLRVPSLEPTPTLDSTSAATPSTVASSRGPERDEPDHDSPSDPEQSRAYYTAHGRFAGQVADAIDVKAGFTPASHSHQVPFVDAPLFGELDLQSTCRVPDSSTEWPSREYADRLVEIYWEHVDPVEPVLDRHRFFHDYEASYTGSGATLHADRDVWPSMLFTVFALAVQRQESTPLQRRDQEGNYYFQRAWACLRPETILWKPGSLELVQCLMLQNRYLHCTDNQQKTWMTAGLAIRIAQTMCCHIPEPPSARGASVDARLRRQLWATCVALDRCVTWSLGRTSAPSLVPLPDRINSVTPNSGTWSLELQEIGNQIQLAQTQTRNPLAASLGLPRLYQQDEYHAVAVQLDAALNRWEARLPADWQLDALRNVSDRTVRAKRYLLHLRHLHSRIFLYRPMLARYYSMKTQPSPPTPSATRSRPSSSLGDRLLKECASLCVEAAQRVTALILETVEASTPSPSSTPSRPHSRSSPRMNPSSSSSSSSSPHSSSTPSSAGIGLLPWWNRIYYLHIAGTHFLAAMCTPDLFTHSVEESWHAAMDGLRAHCHLSAYVQACVRNFETLAMRILATRCPELHALSVQHHRQQQQQQQQKQQQKQADEGGIPSGNVAESAVGVMSASGNLGGVTGEHMGGQIGGNIGQEAGLGVTFDDIFHDFDGLLFAGDDAMDYGWR